MIDASEIAPNLWQGADPPRGSELQRLGFHTLILCAVERQSPSDAFPGLTVMHVPMDDNAHVPVRQAHAAAREAATQIRAGAKVIATCQMGINRSGLVTALALWYLTGATGTTCLNRMRAARPTPANVHNKYFAAYLCTLPSRPIYKRRHPLLGA